MPEKPKSEATGTFGKPPAHAPHETTKPLSPELVATQAALAAQNEQSLKPFPVPASQVGGGVSLKPSQTFSDAMGAQQAAIEAQVTEQVPGGEANLSSLPKAGEIGKPGGGAGEAAEPLVPPPQAYQPAASNTDTPSKGQPHPITDPGKVITGGWGTPTGSQYFALSGDELRVLVADLMARVMGAMQEDLRFSVALTYPQVKATVTVTVEGASADAGVNDVRFELTATAADTQETPADYHRDQTGQAKPYKRQVGKLGSRPILVDIAG